MPVYLILLAAVAAERMLELTVSRRNVAWSQRRGGIEYGAGHYLWMVLLHTGLLAGCAVEAAVFDRPFMPALGWPMFALVIGAQAMRWWCIATLGRRWSTRVLVIPGAFLVISGPYRFLRHPNYAAVAVEGIALPLVYTCWITAGAFTVLNAALLRVRVRVENAALDEGSTSCTTC